MLSMTTEQDEALEIDSADVGGLDLEGGTVPYIDLNGYPTPHAKLRAGGTEYAYERSFPIAGHSALMPGAVAELEAAGKRVLIAERSERYYVYVA